MFAQPSFKTSACLSYTSFSPLRTGRAVNARISYTSCYEFGFSLLVTPQQNYWLERLLLFLGIQLFLEGICLFPKSR
jgi:hypothetical protein